MKTIAKYLAIIIISSGTMFTSCVSKKKMNALTAHVEQLKKDSIVTHRKLDAKMTTALKKQNTHEAMHESHTSAIPTNPEHFTPLPPSGVDSVFKINYPYANETVWTRETAYNLPEKTYKVSFLLQEKRQSVVYTEDGKLVETRVEILPDQLPENVHMAIKKQFPEEQIVTASTYKSTRIDGSYTAVIKSRLHATETILIVTEDGKIVKH